MEIKVIKKNNETILPICFIGKNRNPEVLEYHKKVMEFFNIPMNYLEWDFSRSGHGDAVQLLINQTLNQPIDYYWFCDMDLIPLRKDFIDIMYDKIKDKNSIFGPALATNHRKFQEHIYAGLCCLSFSKQLYLELGCPTMTDIIERSDNGQELTWKAQEKGKNICLMYPTSFNNLTQEEIKSSGNPEYFKLSSYFKYGLGTTFGDGLIFHAFMQSLPRSAEVFINKSKEILNENKKIEAIIVCKNYGDYLSITLPENKKYFDNIIIITDIDDIKTQEVCKKENVNCVIYDGFNKNGAKFNFGGARQYGLKYLKHYDWIVFLDADIIIKQNFKEKLKDPNKFYGSYRRFIPTLNDYKFISSDGDRDLNKFERIEGSGCGFFQGFNHKNINCQINLWELYNDSYSADEADIDFLKKFCPLVENDPNLVRMNIELWHLGPHGVNHEGKSNLDKFFNE